MTVISAYVSFVNTETTYTFFRCTDGVHLYNNIKSIDKESPVFKIGGVIEVLDKQTEKFIKWKVVYVEFRVMDGYIAANTFDTEEGSVSNPFNTELRIHMTKVAP